MAISTLVFASAPFRFEGVLLEYVRSRKRLRVGLPTAADWVLAFCFCTAGEACHPSARLPWLTHPCAACDPPHPSSLTRHGWGSQLVDLSSLLKLCSLFYRLKKDRGKTASRSRIDKTPCFPRNLTMWAKVGKFAKYHQTNFSVVFSAAWDLWLVANRGGDPRVV